MEESKKKNILLTGAKNFIALDLARSLHSAGHRVFVVETSFLHFCKFSNAIEKSFVVPSPRFATEKYIEALVKIVKDHHIEFVIPVFEEVMYLSRGLDQFPKSCKILSERFEVLNSLHNKWLFNQKLVKLGLDAPKTFLIRTFEQLHHIHFSKPYAFKASYSRASQSIYKVKNAKELQAFPIESYNPWIAQEWIDGEKYCSYSFCEEGEVKAHAVYPVRFSISGNSCLTFEAMDHLGIFEWVKHFVKKENFTGQIAFDFIETIDHKLYAIECNPRATHGLLLLTSQKEIVDVLLGKGSQTLFPKTGMTKQLATAMMIYGWKSADSIPLFLKNFLQMPDVIFSRKDIKPFLAQPLIFLCYSYLSLKHRMNFTSLYTHDIDWNGESVEELTMQCLEGTKGSPY
ncbi:MAG: ATP-grasp domain-containing protein [Simkaniaceae bacterium]|nr:ATP-grasp domain-containing protein [Simkaniaceae bacterium]